MTSQEPSNAEVLAAVQALRRDVSDLAPLLARAAVDADMQQYVRRVTELRKKGATARFVELAAERARRKQLRSATP